MENVYDVVIVGAGPAGLTAGIYTARSGMKTLVLDDFSLPSQLSITERIENYPGFPEGVEGPKLLALFKKQAENFGSEFQNLPVKTISQESGAWRITLEGNAGALRADIRSRAVIIASGARPKSLGIKGEDRFKGRGVSYCATCDGALFRGKDIIVIGGGDSALEEALFLTKFVRSIKLIHRRDRLRAAKILQDRVFDNGKIEIVWDSVVEEIRGDAKISSVSVKNLKTSKVADIACDGVFIFAGLIPNTGFLGGVIATDEQGYILSGGLSARGEPASGIFAAGDCSQKEWRQVITACGDGAEAAYRCRLYVEKLKGASYL